MKKVILIGDSIRMCYQETVQQELAGLAEVWGPEENGGNSQNVLNHLDEWVISKNPDLVHINCGIHDLLKNSGPTIPAIPAQQYESNVQEILQRVLKETQAKLVWATTTPVNKKWVEGDTVNLSQEEVIDYNKISSGVAKKTNVQINDLFTTVMQAGHANYLTEDGVHFKTEGYTLLGKRVAEFIKPFLADK